MRKERRDGGMEEVKSFHLPASVRPYPAYTPGAVRHGNNFTSPQQAGAFGKRYLLKVRDIEPLLREYYKSEFSDHTEENSRTEKIGVRRKEKSKKISPSVVKRLRPSKFSPCVSSPSILVHSFTKQTGSIHDNSRSRLTMSSSDPFGLRPEILENKSEDSTPEASAHSEKDTPVKTLPQPPVIGPFSSVPGPLPMDPRFFLTLPPPGSPGTPFFIGANVTDFLERYLLMCRDYRLAEDQIIPRLPWY